MRNLVLCFSIITLTACSSASPATSTTSGSGGSTGTSSSTTGSTTGAGGSTSGACTLGATATTLPACTKPAASTIDVPSGCQPTVDGTYHEGEWSDATCVTVGTDPVDLKFSGDTLYLAWPMTPACGCPAQVAFSTDGAQALDGKQFDLGIFDDPSSASGDSSEFVSQSGAWGSSSTVASGIVIANPPSSPPLVTYELAIPFSQLGITAGQAKTVGLALNHPMSGVWPTGLTVPTGMYQPATPSDWGKLTSAADWH